MIREAKYDDLGSILKLYKYLNPKDDYSEKTCYKKVWKTILNNGEFFKYFVLEDDNKILATCTITINPNLTRSCRPYAVIENVVTDPKHQNRGYGKKY